MELLQSTLTTWQAQQPSKKQKYNQDQSLIGILENILRDSKQRNDDDDTVATNILQALEHQQQHYPPQEHKHTQQSFYPKHEAGTTAAQKWWTNNSYNSYDYNSWSQPQTWEQDWWTWDNKQQRKSWQEDAEEEQQLTKPSFTELRHSEWTQPPDMLHLQTLKHCLTTGPSLKATPQPNSSCRNSKL